jgi:radical SAM superfamily enzyme YgiQ (UPF0313 family)
MARSMMTYSSKEEILLVALPTLPKGNAPLALPYLAGVLGKRFGVAAIDLNVAAMDEAVGMALKLRPLMAGLSVQAQNCREAERLSTALRKACPGILIVWGGEYATLLPDACAPHADCVVRGLFDPVAEAFMDDLASGRLQPLYQGGNSRSPSAQVTPDWQAIGWPSGYVRFMGLPLETTRGCPESCAFCMVHVMQPKHYHARPLEAVKADIDAIGNEHINIIDYNFGVSSEHVEAVCALIASSSAKGFTCEMTLALLDSDRVLTALRKARCRVVYCGLESLEPAALRSVGKHRTNDIENYRRIISKARAAGIQVASGLIIGMEHSSPESYRQARAFFEDVGIYYVKLTFLTFNPGTRTQAAYAKRGTFLTADPRLYDGNNLTFLPNGVDALETYKAAELFIRAFYTPSAILRRAHNARMGLVEGFQFVLFNLLFGRFYRDWLRAGALRPGHNPHERLNKTLKRPFWDCLAERMLMRLWH